MKKPIFLSILLTSTFLSVWILTSSATEIRELQDFKSSTFLKKYRQKGQMSSWPLRNGGYNYSISFHLGNPPAYDEYDWFSVDLTAKSEKNPVISNFGIMFHDESTRSGPTRLTPHIKAILQDFIGVFGLNLPIKDITDYVQKNSVVRYKGILDAPPKQFGKYSFRVGIVGHDLIIDVEKAP